MSDPPLHDFKALRAWERPPGRSAADDFALLAKCTTYIEFQRYATGAVLGKVAEFVYGDFELEGNQDNGWWFTTERWRMLVHMNRCGLVTLEAEEGDETAFEPAVDAWYEGRGLLAHNKYVHLCFLCPARHVDALQRAMDAARLIMVHGPVVPGVTYGRRWPQLHWVKTFVDGDRIEQSPVAPWPIEEVENPPPQACLRDVRNCIVFDPFANRTAHGPGGVFRELVRFLKGSALREEFGRW